MAFSDREIVLISQILDIPVPTSGAGNMNLRVIDSSMRGAVLVSGEVQTGTPANLRSYLTTYVESNPTYEAMARDLIAEYEEVASITASVSGGNAAIGALQGASWNPDAQRKNIRHRLQSFIPFMRSSEFWRTEADGKHNVSVPGVR